MTRKDVQDFCEIVENCLEKRRMSKGALASATGIHRTTIFAWLRGDRDISSERLALIFGTLDLAVGSKDRFDGELDHVRRAAKIKYKHRGS